MPTITVHQAKTQLSKLIEKAEQGEEIVIARGHNPVVRLVPIQPAPQQRPLGLFKHAGFHLGPEFFEPLPPEEMEGWE